VVGKLLFRYDFGDSYHAPLEFALLQLARQLRGSDLSVFMPDLLTDPKSKFYITHNAKLRTGIPPTRELKVPPPNDVAVQVMVPRLDK